MGKKEKDKVKLLQQSTLSKTDKSKIYEVEYNDKNFRYISRIVVYFKPY